VNLKALFQSLLFWLVLSSGIAYAWPAESIGFDPFVPAAAYKSALLWTLISVAMFCLGTLVRTDELRPLAERPWWVGLGVATQVIVMPAIAWLVTLVIPMEEEIAAGVILVGCVPGAMASNVLTSTARGSVAYSVSLTTVATLLSPLTVPLVLRIVAGAETEHSLAESSIRLALLVVLPTLIGFMVSCFWKRFRDSAERWSSVVAAVALLWIIAIVVAGNREKLVSVGLVLAVALVIINLVGYIGGWSVGGLAKLPDRFRRALTLEVGMQNAGLGTGLATLLYGADTAATIPTAAYTFGCMLTGTILAVWWQRKGQPDQHSVDSAASDGSIMSES
jgi:BASS family bile acid:Na+ symporter